MSKRTRRASAVNGYKTKGPSTHKSARAKRRILAKVVSQRLRDGAATVFNSDETGSPAQ